LVALGSIAKAFKTLHAPFIFEVREGIDARRDCLALTAQLLFAFELSVVTMTL
jgi:hypothetical protein